VSRRRPHPGVSRGAPGLGGPATNPKLRPAAKAGFFLSASRSRYHAGRFPAAESPWHGDCYPAHGKRNAAPAAKAAKEPPMNRADLTEKILDIKREKGWTWKFICEQIGGMSPMLVTGALLGQMKLTKPLAVKAAELFGLGNAEQAMLNEVPNRGTPMPPTDPLIYRFYELVMVNGPAWKALIEEEFGDGIMSAIDFDLQMERQPDPRGDRVKITMSGKFLPFKYYGATGNAPQYGYKEE
jgi:cyanate lyase